MCLLRSLIKVHTLRFHVDDPSCSHGVHLRKFAIALVKLLKYKLNVLTRSIYGYAAGAARPYAKVPKSAPYRVLKLIPVR